MSIGQITCKRYEICAGEKNDGLDSNGDIGCGARAEAGRFGRDDLQVDRAVDQETGERQVKRMFRIRSIPGGLYQLVMHMEDGSQVVIKESGNLAFLDYLCSALNNGN